MPVSSQPALLGYLMTGPRHGYELHRDHNDQLGQVWHIGRSKLYAQLKQLAGLGWVTVQIQNQPDRPPRKVYGLTPAGREAFLTWLHEPTSHLRHVRLEFLARVYFFQRLALPGLEHLVAGQKALLQERVDALDQAAARTEDRFERLVLEFRRGQMEAVIRWLDHCLEVSC